MMLSRRPDKSFRWVWECVSIFAESGHQRISQRLMDGLAYGKDAMPQFAGTKQRVAILQAAQTMTDQYVAGQLKALAEDYKRRAEKAAHADAAKALARSAARECEALS
jgi:hypothetical protein